MNKKIKKRFSFFLAVIMILLTVTVLPDTAAKVQAAAKVYWNPFSAWTVTYKPGDGYNKYSAVLSISGSTKASEIKSLKSSNPSVCKVTPKEGYIRAEFGNKAGKSVITCTVKGVKLKKTFIVKKYTNPLAKMTLGKTNVTSKFAGTDDYKQNKTFKNQKLVLQAAKGWTIKYVSVYNGSQSQRYSVNKPAFTKKVSLTDKYGTIYIGMYNQTTKVTETLTFRKTNS